MALQSSPWWQSDKQEGLKSRIAKIQTFRDPGTNADEILRFGKVLLFILLCFTGMLGGISYYKNFSGTFPEEAAVFMAAALTFVIEWGKNYAAKWAVRIPYFRSFSHLIERPENTLVWLGLFLIAGATFYMSVSNSTIGGHQLATVLSQERNQSAFAPDTRSIDAQIMATQKQIDEHGKIKWKGTTTRDAQKAIIKGSAALETLQQQRAQTIQQQRADWEKVQGQKEANSNYTAQLVLASGGWVEFLQGLLILLIVSCEKTLDGRLPSPTPAPSHQTGIGYRQHNYASAEQEQRRPIGFRKPEQPEQPPVPITGLPVVPEQKNIVEQWPTAILPEHRPEQEQTTAAAIVADVREWKKRANQCFGRSFMSQSPKAREDNRQRCDLFCSMLEAVGFEIQKDYDAVPVGILEMTEPEQYNIGPDTIRIVSECKRQLSQI